MFYFTPDAANWAVARLIDGAIAGQQMPVWAPLVGLMLAVAGAVVLTVLAVRAVYRRRVERRQPPVGDLLETQEWLADRTVEIPTRPRTRYRGRRRAPRGRRPRQRVVPAHPVRAEAVATLVIPRALDEPDATAILTLPRGRWGSR